jgi:uncharacterized repeat protein (TIGR03837 family)
MLWDIFCKVIDNYGDIGVCWRLAVDLATRGEQVRLWIDDPSPLAWMAPEGTPGVQVHPWAPEGPALAPGDVVIEAFGCDLAPAFVAGIARKATEGRRIPWINLEYLSAEPYVERMHALPSPVLSGPGAGLVKHFFYPGFTPRTGGLLREPAFDERRRAFGAPQRRAWLASHAIDAAAGERLVSLFCYEPAALRALLDQLASASTPTRLLVTAGRAQAAVRALFAKSGAPLAGNSRHGNLGVTWLPHLTQWDFDHLLWVCDLNFVRGEDSLVRALWAAKPFVWQIYPQDDDAHYPKLEALLDKLDAPASLRDFHRAWNGLPGTRLPAVEWAGWGPKVEAVAADLAVHPDLTQQLHRFVLEKR